MKSSPTYLRDNVALQTLLTVHISQWESPSLSILKVKWLTQISLTYLRDNVANSGARNWHGGDHVHRNSTTWYASPTEVSSFANNRWKPGVDAMNIWAERDALNVQKYESCEQGPAIQIYKQTIGRGFLYKIYLGQIILIVPHVLFALSTSKHFIWSTSDVCNVSNRFQFQPSTIIDQAKSKCLIRRNPRPVWYHPQNYAILCMPSYSLYYLYSFWCVLRTWVTGNSIRDIEWCESSVKYPFPPGYIRDNMHRYFAYT